MNGDDSSKAIVLSVNPTIEQYRSDYAQADSFCMQVQDFVSEAGIPAMNELRNAGHHLLRAIDDSGDIRNFSELIKAINHTKRACYEAGEAGILVALDHIRTFKEDFRNVQLIGIMPDYLQMMQNCETARQAMLAVRTDDEDRSNDYQLRMDSFSTLRDICRQLDVARPEAIKLIQKEQADGRRFLINIGLTALGIVVTIAIAIIAT